MLRIYTELTKNKWFDIDEIRQAKQWLEKGQYQYEDT